jgi:phage baseplate assembly protein W
MAIDVQLAWDCSHLTLEERIALAPDRRSLPTTQPVASDTLVGVVANYDVAIPRTGLYTTAKLVSFAAGPYTLVENETDLTIVTSSETVSLSLPASQFLTAHDLATQINRASQSKKTVAASENGRLTISDVSNVGGNSAVQVFGLSLPKLSLDKQSGAQGRMLYPPWQLYTPAGQITARYPRFTQPLSGNPILTVSYATSQQRCLRCRGTGVENDYRFTADAQTGLPAGSIFMVQNEDLLYQAALKIILTVRGSNPFHPSYGSTVLSRVGSKSLTATAAAINQDVRRALSILQQTQQSQARVQKVTAREQLYNILSVNTTPDQYDPTVYYVDVTVQNASTTPIDLRIVYATAGVTSRNGSLVLGNQAFGGVAR